MTIGVIDTFETIQVQVTDRQYRPIAIDPGLHREVAGTGIGIPPVVHIGPDRLINHRLGEPVHAVDLGNLDQVLS